MEKIEDSKYSPTILKDYWHISDAARKGAFSRMKKYGDLGTPEGRRKGGLASMETHRLLNNGFFKLSQPVETPALSEDLAELLGILIGDGHLSDYQVSITTNSLTDKQHAIFVAGLIKKLFKKDGTISFKKNQNAMDVVVSSKSLVEVLNGLGMQKGNKIKNNLSVPSWIVLDCAYEKAFLRGLFDTDGCIYLDKHTIRGKLYKNLGWTVTSYADKLRIGIIEILERLEFGPTYQESQKSVFLRRKKDIEKYFQDIGTHNDKHRDRFNRFFGEVA